MTLSAEDLRVINDTAARRWAGGSTRVDDDALDAAVAAQRGSDSVQVRAATIAAELLNRRVFGTAALQTALLALHCSLSLDGYQLLAPQGVTAGMVRALAAGDNPTLLTRWLEDRAVSSSAS